MTVTPEEVLKKHLELKPKMTVAMSVTDTGMSIDISVPGILGDLLLFSRLFDREINKIIASKDVGMS